MQEESYNNDHEALKAFHKRYTTQREKLHDVSLELSGRHSKTIIALSGGALALSGTFLNKIFPNPDPSSLKFILMAWGAFLISLLTHLVSLKVGENATKIQMQILGRHYEHVRSAPSYQEGVDSWKEPENKGVKLTEKFINFSLISLVIGVIFLFIYSVCNFFK